MASELLQRSDLSLYVVAGLPKSFAKKLKTMVRKEASDADAMQVDPEMAEWMISRLRGEKRRSHEQTPASAALWRAYSALSAARYHLQHHPVEPELRELRAQVETLWREVSPLFPDEDLHEEAAEAGDSGEGGEGGEEAGSTEAAASNGDENDEEE